MKLTVAIPTFNRKNQLTRGLNALLPQFNNNCFLLILDNFSEIPVADFIDSILDNHNPIEYKIIRNKVNLGADANFMRCFEYCETEYIWTLSDDENIEPDAIKKIFEELESNENNDIAWLNFNARQYLTHKKSKIVNNVPQLFKEIDSFSNLLLLSTSVYKVKSYFKHIRYSTSGAYSMASQIIPGLIALGRGENMLLSEKVIISSPEVNRANMWPQAQQCLGLSSVLEFPLNLKKKEYVQVGKILFRDIETFPRLLCDILKAVECDTDLIDSYHKYIFKKIYSTTIIFRHNKLKQRIEFYICLVLLNFKFILSFLVRNTKIKSSINSSSNYPIFKR